MSKESRSLLMTTQRIHTNRRPTQDKASTSINMCTIVVKAFKTQKAVKLQMYLEISTKCMTQLASTLILV
ncbi:hypothetical protein QZH41_012904 [Actinostola sp. cb2023]|nr:hypothetical protein QZH41_012904 [Actinostola sp. cb2023]